MNIRRPEVLRYPGKFDGVIVSVEGSELATRAAIWAANGSAYHLRQLVILREITSAITSTSDLQGILDSLLAKIDRLLPYAASTVRLFDKQGKLKPIACRNIPMDEWKRGLGAGFVTEILERRAPVISLDVQTDKRSRGPAFFSQIWARLISCYSAHCQRENHRCPLFLYEDEIPL